MHKKIHSLLLFLSKHDFFFFFNKKLFKDTNSLLQQPRHILNIKSPCYYFLRTSMCISQNLASNLPYVSLPISNEAPSKHLLRSPVFLWIHGLRSHWDHQHAWQNLYMPQDQAPPLSLCYCRFHFHGMSTPRFTFEYLKGRGSRVIDRSLATGVSHLDWPSIYIYIFNDGMPAAAFFNHSAFHLLYLKIEFQVADGCLAHELWLTVFCLLSQDENLRLLCTFCRFWSSVVHSLVRNKRLKSSITKIITLGQSLRRPTDSF